MAFPPSAKWSTGHLNRCNQLWPARPCPVLGTRQLLKVPEPFLKWPLRYALLVQDRFSGVRPRQPCSSRWGVATPALLYFTTCSTTNFHHTIRRVFVPHQTGPRCQPAPASASQQKLAFRGGTAAARQGPSTTQIVICGGGEGVSQISLGMIGC